jgi:hypothetical protein
LAGYLFVGMKGASTAHAGNHVHVAAENWNNFFALDFKIGTLQKIFGYAKNGEGSGVDMLMLVEDTAGKGAAQRDVERIVKASLPSQGVRKIGFRGGSTDETIYSRGEGELWCAFRLLEDEKIPRAANTFGVFDDHQYPLKPTVEINVPTTTNSPRVAGFFARDPATDAVYLMHDGGVGGGKPGVGRDEFLSWSRSNWSSCELLEVERSNSEPREGILIGRVDSVDLPSRIWRYVQIVRAFKDAVDRGELDNAAVRARVAEWKEYRTENSGRRRGSRRSEIDYVSYHGDVVHLLKVEREDRKASQEQILNSPLIDLFVKSGNTMTEIYEVKTNLDRQSLYTAVGQLITHSVSGGADVKRVLVVPEGDMPEDLRKCIELLHIKVRRFRFKGGGVERKVVLL